MNLLADCNEFFNLIRQMAVESVDASKPTSLVFGTVTSDSPLKINVEQKMTLTAAQLVLTRNVTDYKIDMDVNHFTENESGGSGDLVFDIHKHAYNGKKQFIIHNALVVGDEVILVRVQGGQKYIVIDRVVKS